MSTLLLILIAVLVLNVLYAGVLTWSTRNVPVRARPRQRTRGLPRRW